MARNTNLPTVRRRSLPDSVLDAVTGVNAGQLEARLGAMVASLITPPVNYIPAAFAAEIVKETQAAAPHRVVIVAPGLRVDVEMVIIASAVAAPKVLVQTVGRYSGDIWHGHSADWKGERENEQEGSVTAHSER